MEKASREGYLKAIGTIRKVLLVASKAFDVADIIGQEDPARERMRAANERALKMTDNIDNVEDLSGVFFDLCVALADMERLAKQSAESTAPKGFMPGGVIVEAKG